MITEYLERPLSVDELLREHEERITRAARIDDLVRLIMRGQSDFWSQAHNEHAERTLAAVRKLLTQRHLSDAMRWQALETAVRGLAGEWATWMVEEK